jgi:serpin B
MTELALDGNVTVGIFLPNGIRPEKYKDRRMVELELKDWDGNIDRLGDEQLVTKGTKTGGNELLTANGLWLQTGFAIEPSFERTLASDYRAPLTLLDFIADSETARSRINEWTEEHPKQKIKNLLPAGSLDSRTRLVLTSAIYSYGKWQDPFVTSRTQAAVFTLPTGATITADFMN